MIHVPSKIQWLVDLRKTPADVFPHEVLHMIGTDTYTKGIQANILPAREIRTLFSPIYRRLIMARSDFRLDVRETEGKLRLCSTNDTYQLYWFRTALGEDLGGVVLHFVDTAVRVAYRAFDHEAAGRNRLSKLDYYADFLLQNRVRSMGYSSLTHGTDRHPLTSLGLSVFKLRIGALPAVYNALHTTTFDPLCHVGYYAQPVDGVYTAFVRRSDPIDQTTHSFMKTAARVGIAVLTAGEGS